MEKKGPSKITIDNSNKAFYTDNVSVLHGKGQFVIDFRQTTPRMDNVRGEQKLSFVTRHETVVMNPQLAKSLLEVLTDSVEKYEKQFGSIKMPKKKSATTKKVETPGMSYIG
jgi:hypothetical protein